MSKLLFRTLCTDRDGARIRALPEKFGKEREKMRALKSCTGGTDGATKKSATEL